MQGLRVVRCAPSFLRFFLWVERKSKNVVVQDAECKMPTTSTAASGASGDDAAERPMTSAAASGASGFLLGDDAVEFMRERGEQTWEAANEAGGRAVEWEDDCARCGDGSGLRVLCGYCHLVFHPTCLDPPTGVENWDDEVFACGRCVTDAMGKAASTMPGARLMRELRQRRATTAAAEARRAARRRHAERARRARAEIIVARCPEIIVARCRPHRAAS